jgi:nicotinate phosphoribosyltransferase
VNGKPCVKLSEEMTKATFPGKKNAYRLYDKENRPLIDMLAKSDEEEPQVGAPILCRHPFLVKLSNQIEKKICSIFFTQNFISINLKETKRAYLTPSRVESLLVPFWRDGRVVKENIESIEQAKQRAKSELGFLRSDHKRNMNPTPYKVGF